MQFNISIHDGARTRWLCDQSAVVALVKGITENICEAQTEGDLPTVRASVNQCRCELCEDKADEAVRKLL